MTSWSIRQVCESWGVPAASSDFSQPVTSDIPTLLLHGQYDPRLTTEYAFQVAQTLPNSYTYIVPGVSHQATLSSCAQTIAAAFISNPTQEPTSNCLNETPAPAWVLPSEIYATPAMVNLIQATMEPLNPLTLLLVVICLLVFAAALIRAVRGKTLEPVICWLSALVALSGMVTLLVLIAQILSNLSNSTLVGFGIPGGMAWIRFLPLLVGVVAAVFTLLVGLHWLRRTSEPTRSLIFSSVVAIAGLFVGGWLLTLGFLP